MRRLNWLFVVVNGGTAFGCSVVGVMNLEVGEVGWFVALELTALLNFIAARKNFQAALRQ